MKIKNILYATLFSASLLFQSCSLDEDTSGISSPDNFFRKYSECQSVVNSCYIPIKSIYTYTYMLATECVTDIAYCPSGTRDASLDISPAVPRFGSTVWTQGYLGVQRCNFAVNGIERAYQNEVLSEEQYLQLLCEAKTLRAFYYWTLTCFFGNVPFYFDDVTDNEVLNRIQVLPRMDADETRATVSKTCSRSRRSSTRLAPTTTRPTGWEPPAPTCSSPKWPCGTRSGTRPSKRCNRSRPSTAPCRSTPESIMEIQHNYTQGGLTYTSNVACICQPYPRSANSSIYDGVDIPELGDQATVWTAMRPNVYFCQGLQSKMGKDIRAKYNMAWGYEDKTFNSTNTRPWCGPKFWCPNMQASADGNNYKVFRYADALLMMAECYFYKENYEKSIEYLDMTRTRAGLGNYIYRTPARLEEEIRNERARELFGEFQRKYDLVRWGIWYDAVTSNSDYGPLQLNTTSSLIKPCHRYYPIPDTEVTYSKNNLDNNEYKAYGL